MLAHLLVGAVLLSQAAAPTSANSTVYTTDWADNLVAAVSGNSVTATVDTLDLKGVGGYPIQTATARNGSMLYVLDDENTPPEKHFFITEINTATNKYVGRVRLGFQPDRFLVSPDGKQAYVLDNARITIINLHTGANTYFTNLYPTDEALSPDGGTLYVSDKNDQLLAINTTTRKVVATTPTNDYSDQALAVTPDGQKVYVESFGTLTVVDTTTHAVTRTAAVIPGGSYARNSNTTRLAITPDGRVGYVYRINHGTYSVIDLATGTVTSTVNQALIDLQFSATGTVAYGIGPNAGYSIDPATGAIIATTTGLGTGAHGLALTGDGSRAVVTNATSNTASLIDVAGNAVTATTTVGSGPSAVSTVGGKAFVANAFSATVSVVDAVHGTPIATVPSGFSYPQVIGESPDGRTVYVGGFGDNLRVIDTATNTIDGNVVGIGGQPKQIVFSADSKRAYVVATNSTIAIVDTATRQVTQVPVGGTPLGLALGKDGAHVYITKLNDSVDVFDTATNTVTRSISLGDIPGSLALSPDGTTLYVSVFPGLDVIDTASGTVTGTLPESNPFAVSPDGATLYTRAVAQIQAISTATGAVTTTYDAPSGAGYLDAALSPDGTRLYGLENYALDTFDVASGTMIATATLPWGHWDGLATA
jgi:YVTN family beta-propeller protein